MSLREEWIQWRKCESRVIMLGEESRTDSSGNLEDRIKNSLENKDIFIIIPGNPGLAGFYIPFMKSLYSAVGNPDLSIWSISHVGHDTVAPSWIPIDETFNLEDQILHKSELLDKLVPTSARITLIGHSIGCKIIMEMFKRNTTHTIAGCYFLFPTIENMLNTSRGKKVYPLTTMFRIPFIILISILYMLLPGVLVDYLSGRIGAPGAKNQVHLQQAVRALLNPNHVNNCLVMAGDELENVKELDTQTIQAMTGKLRVYYGMKDEWCPLHNRLNLLQVEGMKDEDAVVDGTGMKHAFVLEAGEQMGHILGEWNKKPWTSHLSDK